MRRGKISNQLASCVWVDSRVVIKPKQGWLPTQARRLARLLNLPRLYAWTLRVDPVAVSWINRRGHAELNIEIMTIIPGLEGLAYHQRVQRAVRSYECSLGTPYQLVSDDFTLRQLLTNYPTLAYVYPAVCILPCSMSGFEVTYESTAGKDVQR